MMHALRGCARWLVHKRMFVLIALTYAYFYQGGDPNQASRFYLTKALVERHEPDITPDHFRVLDKGYFRGKYFSDKAPGVSLLATVPYAALRMAERAFHLDAESRGVQRARLHMLSFLTSSLAGAVAAYALWRTLLLLRATPVHAELLTLGYALGTLAFPFSTVMFGHQTAAALLIGSYFMMLQARETGSLSPRVLTLLGFLWAWSLIIEYPTGLLVALLGLHLLSWDLRPRAVARTLAWTALGSLVPLALHSAFLCWAFGSPLDLPYKHLVEPIFLSHTSTGFLGIGTPTAVGIFGTLLSRYRGLFFFSPFLILAFAGYGAWIRCGERLSQAALLGAMSIVYILFSASYYAWDGGGSIGPRHLVPVLPFCVVPIAYFVRQGRWSLWLTRAAVVLSTVIMSACVAVRVQLPEGDPYALDVLYGVVVPALVRGELSSNLQDIYYVGTRRDASYNLGLLLHLPPFVSLCVPVLAWIAVLAFGPKRFRDAS